MDILSYLDPILLRMIDSRLKPEHKDEKVQNIVEQVSNLISIYKVGCYIEKLKYSEIYRFFCYKDYKTHIRINIAMNNKYDPVTLIRYALEINHVIEELRKKYKNALTLRKFINKLILKYFISYAETNFTICKKYNIDDIQLTFTKKYIKPDVEIIDMRDELYISKELDPNFLNLIEIVEVFNAIDENGYINGIDDADVMFNAYFIELCAIVCDDLKYELERYVNSILQIY